MLVVHVDLPGKMRKCVCCVIFISVLVGFGFRIFLNKYR